MDDYAQFRYSVTCKTNDDAVLHCLRGLCQWSEKHAKPQIGWGGTTLSSWKDSGGLLTLRFTDTRFRDRFLLKANELLAGRWSVISTSDSDPAARQRSVR
jgi:hypothetical protein